MGKVKKKLLYFYLGFSATAYITENNYIFSEISEKIKVGQFIPALEKFAIFGKNFIRYITIDFPVTIFS